MPFSPTDAPAQPHAAAVGIERVGDRLVVSAPAYRLSIRLDRPYGTLDDADGRAWADLALLAAVGALDGPDEWLAIDPPTTRDDDHGPVLAWRIRSARWESETLVLEPREDHVRLHVEVTGNGLLDDVELLAGTMSAIPRMGTGRFESGRRFGSLVDPSPNDPGRTIARSDEPAYVGIVGGSPPGRGRWFFTPGPFAFAVALDAPPGPTTFPHGPWLAIALATGGIEQATFTSYDYVPGEGSWSIRLRYEGHTPVRGSWRSPDLLLVSGASDPYDAIARGASLAEGRPSEAAAIPAWWREPIFCGWGAQAAAAKRDEVPVPTLSRRDLYDGWLARLESAGAIPGTVVIDDKWQASYGRNEPDHERWPDLRGWIADRHRRGQRVLLWWKAWDAEGLAADLCIRNGAGTPVAADPTNPAFEHVLRDGIRRMLGAADDCLDADGLKIDFTGMSPSGPSLRTFAERNDEDAPWGVALLHRLLAIVADEARRIRPDALLVTHTPNPLFRDVVSVIRLNDTLRLDDPRPVVSVVPQMRHRAAIAAAGLPGVPIDTDDWCMPSRAEWLAYLEAKPALGIPALYYVEAIDFSGEEIGMDDLRRVAAVWRSYRRDSGLPERG
jgi:hypothetical protein